MEFATRRDFLKSSMLMASTLGLMGGRNLYAGGIPYRGKLDSHTIEDVAFSTVHFNWPRFVGKNSRKDFHGQHKTMTVCRLTTNQGAVGWGLASSQATKQSDRLANKRVSDLISVESGIADPALAVFDIALHDLMGVILDEPVYKLLGANGSKSNPVYSGMIYIDELNEGNSNKNIDIILENCQWDYDYGYRQLKIKIGRSGKWYPHAKGLAKDIEVVNEIHKAFHKKGVKLLVDANNMYSLEDTLAFLKGVSGVPLLWFEEPFHENVTEGRKLRRWMKNNGFADTLYADGEYNPDHSVLMELSRTGDLGAYLSDIQGYGFTKWRRLMPEIEKLGVLASPHAWGNAWKTNASAHLAAGLGNTVTLEGVTCVSKEIDFGNYRIKNGRLHVSDAPGFGMKLKL